jgi:hypothetical protein
MEWFLYFMELAVQQWGESFGLNMEALEKGYEAALSDLIGKVQSAHIPVCTTLVVGQGVVKKLFEPEAFLARPETIYLPPWYLDAFRHGKEKHQVMFKGNEEFAPFKHKMELVLLRKLKQAGVNLVLSTDAGPKGDLPVRKDNRKRTISAASPMLFKLIALVMDGPLRPNLNDPIEALRTTAPWQHGPRSPSFWGDP